MKLLISNDCLCCSSVLTKCIHLTRNSLQTPPSAGMRGDSPVSRGDGGDSPISRGDGKTPLSAAVRGTSHLAKGICTTVIDV